MPQPDNPHDFPPFFTPSQWLTLYSLTSIVFPALEEKDVDSLLAKAPADINPEYIKAFAATESYYTNAEFRSSLELFLSTKLPASKVKGFAFVLGLLNSITGCLLLTYSTTPFHLQPAATREQLLHGWINPNSHVLFPPIRGFAKGVVAITQAMWSRSIPADILYGATGYEAKSGRTPGEGDYEEVGEEGKRSFYKFQFLNFLSPRGQEVEGGVKEIEYDVVIVGSGCGGAVVAARLAKEGYKVVVVEKGVWHPTDTLPLSEHRAINELFENNMVFPSDDGSLAVVAGTTFGGGGMVNWAASLQTQGYVREEWAKNGLPFFTSQDYQNCMDYVCKRMGVTDKTNHNHRNQTVLEGSRKLGWRAITVPQNTGASLEGEGEGEERMHSDGWCSFGCGCREVGEGRKMGTTQTWLPDAAKAGAKFIQDFYVDKIIFTNAKKTKAVGVEGVWGAKTQGGTTTKVLIKAKKVIVSSGGLHSPAVLMRSGLTNPNIGKNFYAHPASLVTGFFPALTSPMSGSCLTTACTEFENLDGLGHGVKIETSIMPPVAWMHPLPFHNPVQLKRHILNHRHAGSFFAMLREKDPGSVYCDPKTGLPKFSYTPSKGDRVMLLKGIVALSKILFMQGVEEIVPCYSGMPTFKRHPTAEELAAEEQEESEKFENALGGLFWSGGLETAKEEEDFEDPGINDMRFQRWLKKLETYGLPLPQASFVSAHQMGSCRMGSDETVSVVDGKGRVWGTEGLYVADASVFPSASGVNPMISVMAIAHHIAGEVVKDLRREEMEE